MTTDLEALRVRSEKSEKKAAEDKAALLDAAVAEAITSTRYGHLSAVARKAGITSQYLRILVEAERPGFLDEAAAQRDAAKAAKAGADKRAA
ncbi:hypothetical protein ACPXCP_39900 [Streptomyces sp. DT20]|uniref:hypothetical protein n=1 Tax=Streptomyces sp. DT20 TaxID=3416519 RepID=UPI003CF5D232